MSIGISKLSLALKDTTSKIVNSNSNQVKNSP